jgi:hypothetical protein
MREYNGCLILFSKQLNNKLNCTLSSYLPSCFLLVFCITCHFWLYCHPESCLRTPRRQECVNGHYMLNNCHAKTGHKSWYGYDRNLTYISMLQHVIGMFNSDIKWQWCFYGHDTQTGHYHVWLQNNILKLHFGDWLSLCHNGSSLLSPFDKAIFNSW